MKWKLRAKTAVVQWLRMWMLGMEVSGLDPDIF